MILSITCSIGSHYMKTSSHSSALSSLYRKILTCRANILGSVIREFVMSEVCYIERIYNGLIRQGPKEPEVSVRNIEMFVIPAVDLINFPWKCLTVNGYL